MSSTPVLKSYTVTFVGNQKQIREITVKAHEAAETESPQGNQVWFLTDGKVSARFMQVLAWWENPPE